MFIRKKKSTYLYSIKLKKTLKKYLLHRPVAVINQIVKLAASKSESNRALIINALSGFKGELKNLASARDTQTLIRLIKSDDPIADVLDAGTTMRFLTAYFSVKGKNKVMTGTARMCERPIGILVDALRELGVEIDYIEKTGYPPIHIKSFAEQKTHQLKIRGDVSSQYISALLMISPQLPQGLELQLLGEVGSVPYITMTIRQMQESGIKVIANWDDKKIIVEPQNYQPATYHIESDWSGASYWYAVVALSTDNDFKIELSGLKQNSLQGDHAIVEIMAKLGVKSTFNENGVVLEKVKPVEYFSWDFSNCPDLTQTVAVVLAGLKIEGTFTGIESLKIKETDRVQALQNELKKIGASLTEVEPNKKYKIDNFKEISEIPEINTYDDHRMAMAFAPMALLTNIIIQEPEVVVKSYPEFWEHLGNILKIEEI